LARKPFIVIAGLALALVTGPTASAAAPGDLDSTFGAGSGKVVLNFTQAPWGGGYADEGHAVAVQSDGKIVLGGSSLVPGSYFDFGIARLLPDGTPDSSFGDGDGRVTTNVGGATAGNYVTDIALQPDGKIVAVGYEGVVVARYTSTGELDSVFGTNGIVTTDLLGSYAWGVALQPDGKIVVTGQYWNGLGNATFIARYTADGEPDSSFGTGGVVTAPGAVGVAFDVAVQPDGKIVIGGGSIGRFTAARYTAGGALDTSFGDGGVAKLESGSPYYSVEGRALALGPDGSIVLAGRITTECCSGGSFGVVRLTPDGALDPSFSGDGTATVGFDGVAYFGDSAGAVVVQPNKKIVVVGRSMQPPTITDFALARFLPDGTLDASFSGDGRLLTVFDYWPGSPGSSEASAVALAPNGAIVAAGYAYTGLGAQDFAVARYIGDATDATPPTLHVPDAMDVNATSPIGAAVTYTATATDDTDPTPVVACTPSSGSTFAIGTTIVTCTATDAAGNEASATFTVHVKDAREQLDAMIVLISADGLGPGSSLAKELQSARAALLAANQSATCRILSAFAYDVRAIAGKSLTADQATELMTAATRIRAVLGC
jgi:uncharacterized delta-60 repeat protein